MEDINCSRIGMAGFRSVCWTNFCYEFQVAKIKLWEVFSETWMR